MDDTLVLGLVTNLRFLRWLVRHPAVLDGEARIDTLERIWPPDDWAKRTAIPDTAWRHAANALIGARREAGDPWSDGFRLNGAPSIRLEAEGEQRSVEPATMSSTIPFVLTGDVVHVDLAGRSTAFRPAPPPDVDRAASAAGAHARTAGPAHVNAPMPGAVLAVHAALGEALEAGDPIVTLEAMKMEHVVVAPVAGRVVDLAVRAGDQVARGQALALVEP